MQYRCYIAQFDDKGNSLPGLFVPGFLAPERTKLHRASDVIAQLEPDGEGFMRVVGGAPGQRQLPVTFGRWTLTGVHKRYRFGNEGFSWFVRVKCSCECVVSRKLTSLRTGRIGDCCHKCAVRKWRDVLCAPPTLNQDTRAAKAWAGR